MSHKRRRLVSFGPTTETTWANADHGPSRSTLHQDIRDIVDSEVKRTIFTGSLLPVLDVSPRSIRISNVISGTSATNRIGNWIQPLAIHNRVVITGNVDSPDPFFECRSMLVLYNNNDRTDPFDPTTMLQNNNAVYGPFDYEKLGNWTILWDEFTLVSNDPGSPAFLTTLDVTLDIRDLPQITFVDNFGHQNHLFAVTLGNALIGDPAPPMAKQATQLYFSDS